MEQYTNINILLGKLNGLLGTIGNFKFSSVYFFITTVFVLSSSVSVGAMLAIGSSLAPLIYGSQMFYMLIFWMSLIMVFIIVSRNMAISLFIDAIDGDSNNNHRIRDLIVSIYATVTKERRRLVSILRNSANIMFTALLIYLFVYVKIKEFPLLSLSVTLFLAILTGYFFIASRGNERYSHILKFYAAIVVACYVSGYLYVTTIKNSNPDVTISLTQPEAEIKSRILLATREGIVIFVDHKPQFHTWTNLRKIVKLEPPFEGSAPQ